MPLLNFKISSIFTKPSKTDPKPTDPPLFKFQLTRKKMFSKTKFIYCFFETFCMSYKNETLKKLKGVLTYSFNLKVTFDPKKISFILSIDVISEEYFCQKQEDLEKIRNYFSKRISLWGFHEIYTAIKKIGKGNFASVFLIEKKATNRLFAAKAFLKEPLMKEKIGIAALNNEITIMRALSHPNIIKLYEVYETKSSFYIVMEVLTGGNLNDFIKNKYVFKPDEIRIIIKTLLKTLQYIHSKNIMHRDIKPENILLRKANIEEKNICFADFGLSTFTNVPEFIYYKCGTPGFVAPEILKLTKTDEKKYGVSCDIFSLGVVFHILLSGKHPFNCDSYSEMIIMNKECKINYNKKFYKNIPSKTLDLLQKMMNPEEFFRPTAEQALEHSYITGIEDISCSINNSTYSCDLKAEENFCSEQEIKTLEMNMLSLNLMGKEVHMMGEIKNSQFKIDEINTSLIKDKELEHKFMINLIEEDSKSNNYLPNYNRKLKGSYSIIIRTPVITGHIGSINSPECKDKKDKDKDDFSPVMKKELNLNQNKGKNLNFTLMACGFDKNN